jgi:hypothetical protein
MLYHIFKLVCLIFLFGRVLYRMKTNRRSKRVKKTRRNRRSRRMQRGGGGGGEVRGDPMYNYMVGSCKKICEDDYNLRKLQGNYSYHGITLEQFLTSCLETCDNIYVPLEHYDEETTVNGWYILSKRQSDHVNVHYYLAHKIMTEGNPHALNSLNPTNYYITTKDIKLMDKKLDELPDLQKTYKTGRWYQMKNKLWKLTYDKPNRLFKWTNQEDKEMTQPFLIESPLKIGDNIATEVK